mmetsp:Transcript_37025/g.75468  ORF Transcript_37025/g.75468 Transcript_37025/m.75468 type:complete len:599 (+) Transcript_37025:230-2026(+)
MKFLAVSLMRLLVFAFQQQQRRGVHALVSSLVTSESLINRYVYHPNRPHHRQHLTTKSATTRSTCTRCFSVVPAAASATASESSSSKIRSAPQQEVVLVRRNRQSMAFRNGSPLVFSGAIESTYTVGSSDEALPPQMGSLVLVSVSPKNNGGGNDRNDRKRGGGRGSKRKVNEGGSNKKSIPHQAINVNNDDKVHEAQVVKNSQDIGYGVYNPESMYRVRILCHSSSHNAVFREVKQILKEKGSSGEGEALGLIVRSKLRDAVKSRLFLNLPSESTDSYRLVNGEGDGLSGLAVDVLGGKVAVVMSSAAWVELHKDLIIECLSDILKHDHPSYESNGGLEIIWRNTPSRLKMDGYLKADDDDGDTESNECVIAKESNVLYQTFPFSSGQKTGFYCDQRDNRLEVANLCNGKRVLDLCCYNGGFALNAILHGGATSCLGVDSSQDAIDAAISNAELNGLDEGKIHFVRDDIAHYMKQAHDEDTEYDVIVLDPPKLAPSTSGLDRASRKYFALNRDAMKLINKEAGGLLLTCTCSGAMTQKEGGNFFLQTIKSAALAAGRQVTMLKKSGAAPCHTQCPASYPAGAYLTAALFYVSPESKR